MYDQYFAGCILTGSADSEMTTDHWPFRNTEQQNQDRAIFYRSNRHQISHIQNKREVNCIIYFGQIHICISPEKYKMTF